MADVILDKISKSYDQHVIIPELSLSIADEEFIVLVGPSGCGKSTALRMIAGLETITSGTIRIGGQVVNNVEPKDRDIAMVFQNYALYPHMSVYDNMAFGLKMRKIPKGTIDEKVRETAKMLELDHLLDRKPRQLSGGQRQRVALGRAIVRNPKVFLMDEPLSNLDAKLRVQMRREILQLHQRIRTTTIYVTHDQVEAMTMGDRIVILNKGQIQQVGRPTDVYEQPNNLFVAGFIGQMNFIPTTYNSEKSQLLLSEGAAWTVPSNARDALKNYNDKPVVLCIRPEHWEPAHNMSQTEGFTIKATPSQIEHLGSEKIIQFPFNGETVLAKVPPDFPVSTGETIHLRVQPEKVLVFDKANEERITVLGSPTMVGANA